MSNKPKRKPLPSWRQPKPSIDLLGDGPQVEDPLVQLEAIFEEAPDKTFLAGEKMAVFSATCCWWSSNPHTVGRTGKGLPACPSCHSVLFQAPLREFIDRSAGTPEHYGEHGLLAFVRAHNFTPCQQQWDDYDTEPGKALEMSDLILPAGVERGEGCAPLTDEQCPPAEEYPPFWTEGDLPGYEDDPAPDVEGEGPA